MSDLALLLIGGIWTYTRELVTGLIARGWRVTLVSFGEIPLPEQTAWMEQLRGLIAKDADHRALYEVFLAVRDAAAKILEHTTVADLITEKGRKGSGPKSGPLPAKRKATGA